MPEEIRMAYRAIKSEARGPIWQFTGLALLTIFIAWMSVSISKENEREKEYIAAPMNGDVYHYKVDLGRYSCMRVVFVTPDSVHVALNEYETNMRTGVNDINKNENYSGDIFGISRSGLLELYETKEIYHVERAMAEFYE
jgi:hypothetical protein